MLQIQQYVKVNSVEEAYELLQKNRNNQILGGMMWLKMQNRSIPTAIDISNLDVHQIEETAEFFKIGAMVNLRQLELHTSLNEWTSNILKDCVKDIVGVQFRNMASLGGSLYSRFGFSDIICALNVLHCEVEVYPHGRMSLSSFLKLPYKQEIISHVYIYKEKRQAAFLCMRNSATDISSLNVAVCKGKDTYQISIGARPKGAVGYTFDKTMNKEDMIKEVMQNVILEDNIRASKAYRNILCKGLLERAFDQVEGTCHDC